jgi:hypothetical protein
MKYKQVNKDNNNLLISCYISIDYANYSNILSTNRRVKRYNIVKTNRITFNNIFLCVVRFATLGYK